MAFRNMWAVAVLFFLTACNDIVTPPTSEVVVPDGEYPGPAFKNDTLISLYGLAFTLPQGWRAMENVATSTDATGREKYLNRNNKKFILYYGGYTSLGNPADDPKERRNYIFVEENISGLDATVFLSKQNDIGYSGVYIDSIGVIRKHVEELTFFAENLNATEQIEFLKVIRSMKIGKFH